jgi:hypothetical protein
MIRTRRPFRVAVALAAWVSTPAPLATVHHPEPAAADDRRPAASSPPAHLALQRIRTVDRRMLKLIHDGMRESPSLRALVRRLEESDVVVYVECDARMPSRVAGRLVFVSAVAGLRYVVVRLARMPSRAQQIAILAHELQHAVEIAGTPAIVDGASLAREYQRFGHVNRSLESEGIAFDTDAAIAMGQKVMGEIVAVGGD